MRYLAKIDQKSASGKAQIQLLAYQTAEYQWEIVTEQKRLTLEAVALTSLLAAELAEMGEGLLVIFDLDNQEQITALQDATDWILEIISQYLTQGTTPGELREEFNRIEQWRQSLTMQSQEVRRRAIETAARRDEIQELEKNLKRKYEELEQRE